MDLNLEKVKAGNNQLVSDNKADQVEIVFYTDPLCCWSWGFEPQWRRLRYEFEGQLRWKYCMGGLIPNWTTFNDPMNVVSKPSQMGPLWMEASQVSGMPINDTVWLNDPPSSSYTACIAVKCAGLQSPEAGEVFLRRLREAVMIKGWNIDKAEVIFRLATIISDEMPGMLDESRFREDMQNGSGQMAFRSDLQQIRYHSISRFPTLTLQALGQKGVIIVGYRPYSVLLEAFRQVAPDLQPSRKADDAETYKRYWGFVTPRETAEALAPENL